MKVWAHCVFAMALMFAASPLCATPMPTMQAMQPCDAHVNTDGKKHGDDNDDNARACHACVTSIAANPILTQVQPRGPIPELREAVQVAESTQTPPTPPPRRENSTRISTFYRS